MTQQASPVARRGAMFVVSSPSGAGKSTLCRKLIAADPHIAMSVSLTTRPPRPSEVDGVDYHFVSKDNFEVLRDSGDLLEWAAVFDNYYGTPRAEIEQRLAGGNDVLFDIDWQGAVQLAARCPGDVVRIFIMPPSFATLAQRLRDRGQDADQVIAKRLAGAAAEIARWPLYDYVIVNDELEASFRTLQGIVAAERARRDRQPGLTAFVDGLLDAARTLDRRQDST